MRTLDDIRKASAAGEEITDKELILMLSTELAEAMEALGRISRMKIVPDDVMNRTTLWAAIQIARAITPTPMEGKP